MSNKTETKEMGSADCFVGGVHIGKVYKVKLQVERFEFYPDVIRLVSNAARDRSPIPFLKKDKSVGRFYDMMRFRFRIKPTKHQRKMTRKRLRSWRSRCLREKRWERLAGKYKKG